MKSEYSKPTAKVIFCFAEDIVTASLTMQECGDEIFVYY